MSHFPSFSDYQIVEELTDGDRCYHVKGFDGEDLFAKITKLNINDTNAQEISNKCRVYDGLRHPAIAPFVGVFKTDADLCGYVTNFYPGESLADKITSMDMTSRLIVLYGLVHAINYLLNNGVKVCNLNNLNKILLDPNGYPVLSGIYFSELISEPISSDNFFYAPEVHESNSMNGESLAFTIGSFAYLIMSGEITYPTKDPLPSVSDPTSFKMFLLDCWSEESGTRQDMSEMISSFDKYLGFNDIDVNRFNEYKAYLDNPSIAARGAKALAFGAGAAGTLSTNQTQPPGDNESIKDVPLDAGSIAGGSVSHKRSSSSSSSSSSGSSSSPPGSSDDNEPMAANPDPLNSDGDLVKADIPEGYRNEQYQPPIQASAYGAPQPYDANSPQQYYNQPNGQYYPPQPQGQYQQYGSPQQQQQQQLPPMEPQISVDEVVAKAKGGDVNSMILYGKMLMRGDQVAMNNHKAAYYFKQAGKRGSGEGECLYGSLLESGNGVPQNFEKAANHYCRSAHLGYVGGHLNYARVLDKGIGTPVSRKAASMQYKLAADQNSFRGMYFFGLALIKGRGLAYPDPNSGSLYVKTAADNGDFEAQNLYGYLLLNGIGTPKSPQDGMTYILNAAQNGCPAAQNALAQELILGKNIDRNYEEAARLLKLAADSGNCDAQNNLARMLEKGIGMKKPNPKQAFELYTKAAREGNMTAILNLALMYQTGNGTSQNLKKSAELLKFAAEKKNKAGIMYYASCLEDGMGVKENKEEALNMYKELADMNLPSGEFQYARCLYFGIGTKKDKLNAKKYMDSACLHGSSKAKAFLVKNKF